MNTFCQFNQHPVSLPSTTGWYLADLGEAHGKQDLFTRQSPQKLKALLEHALIESAVSSNRIRGIEVEQKRIGAIIFGRSPLRDHDEEEAHGYHDVLWSIHERTRDCWSAKGAAPARSGERKEILRGEGKNKGRFKS
jgi:hypothetical protein